VTVLTIAQAIADEVGFPRPASLVGSTDDTARQLLALLNREGQSLVSRYPWSACIRDKSVTVTSGTDTYAVPTDYSRIVDDTIWDTTNRWPMIGPLSSQEWETLQRGIQITTPRKCWRIIGKASGTYTNPSATTLYVQITPTPTNSTDTFYYEYLTTGFARQTTDTSAGTFDNDSDIPILPEQLFIMGGIWRWMRAKGLAYDDEKDAYEREVARCMAQDKSARVLSLSNRSTFGPRFLNYDNVPETGFGD
jgi:hypothetical protein